MSFSKSSTYALSSISFCALSASLRRFLFLAWEMLEVDVAVSVTVAIVVFVDAGGSSSTAVGSSTKDSSLYDSSRFSSGPFAY